MRKITAREHRETAAKIAHDRDHPVHVANGEERAYRDAHSFMSFTKGLPHDEKNGLVKDRARSGQACAPRSIQRLHSRFRSRMCLWAAATITARASSIWHFYPTRPVNTASPIALQDEDDGDQYRKWEAPTAGFVYDLQGPDAQAVTMPPAPPILIQKQGKKRHDPYSPRA